MEEQRSYLPEESLRKPKCKKKVCSSHYFLYNSKFQAKSKMSDMAHCHQNISLCSCALSYWSRSRKFQKSPKQALSSGIHSQCWHPRQVWISFHLKNDYASNCCSTKESSYCKSVRSCPAERPCWDLCSRSAARGDGVTILGHGAGLGGAGEVPGRAPGCCGARVSLFLLRVLSETSQHVLAELLGPVTSVSTEKQ